MGRIHRPERSDASPDTPPHFPADLLGGSEASEIYERTLTRVVISSDLLLAVVEQSGDEFVFVYVNDAMCLATGYERAMLLGTSLATLVGSPDEWGELRHLMGDARPDGNPVRRQVACRDSGGRDLTFGLTLFPDRESVETRLIMIGRDITDAVREREQNARVQSLLAKVFAIADTPIYITDNASRIVMCNAAFDRLVGTRAGELYGTVATDRIEGPTQRAILDGRQSSAADDGDIAIIAKLVCLDGREVECDFIKTSFQQQSLRRFRIITVKPRASLGAGPPAPRAVLVGGRVQLIGLDEIRGTFGARWEEVKDRAMAMAEHVMRRHLRPGDSMVRTNEYDFIVTFPGATEEEANIRAAHIGKAIRTRLIGDGLTREAARVLAITSELPSDAADRPAQELGDVIRSAVDQKLDALHDMARERLKEALVDASYNTRSVVSARRRQEVGKLVELMHGTEAAFSGALSLLPDQETADLDPDGLVLKFAHQCAAEGALHGRKQLVFAQVDSEALLLRKRFDSYLAECGKIGEPLRKQLVLLVAVPSGGTSRLLGDRLMRLRAYFHSFGAVIDANDAKSLPLAELGFKLAMIQSSECGSEFGQAVDVASLAEKLHAQRCALIIDNVRRDEVARLIARGADFCGLENSAAS
jgi:PAS domain S-box-containing protein